MKVIPQLCELMLQVDEPDRFSPHNALALARASQWAYDHPPDIVGPLTDTQAIYLDCGNSRVIAFRGTAGVKDLLTDLNVRGLLSKFIPTLSHTKTTPIGIRGAIVHAGFWRALDEVFMTVLHSVKDDPRPLFITGHSLGGALAYLCGWRLYSWNVFPYTIYTYGQPNVGNKKFQTFYRATKLNAVTWRVVHEEDIVARIPLEMRSAGQKAFFSSDDKIFINPSLLTLADSDFTGIYRALRKGHEDLIADHALIQYLKELD